MNEPRSTASAKASADEAANKEALGKDPSLVALLSSLYRLLKLARIYEGKNQVLVDGAEGVVGAATDFFTTWTVESADIVFANETVFVNGAALHFSRDIYARAMELSDLLGRCGVSNIEITNRIKADDFIAFVQALAKALRDPSLKGEELAKTDFGGVCARTIRWRANLEADRRPVSRVVRTYANAVVIVRRYYAGFAQGKRQMPPAMPRFAARIVSHGETDPTLLVALAASRTSGTDEATIAVNTAVVSVLMARQVSDERAMLANLAVAALLYDVGKRRLTSGRDGVAASVPRVLTADEQERLAPSSAAAIVSLGISDAGAPQAFIAYEAQWLRRSGRAADVYGGRRPVSVLARCLHVARAFCDLMAPGPHASAMGAYDAIQFLGSRAKDNDDHLYVKLLTGALGIFPPGEMVELSTGEGGVVVRVPELPVDFPRPVVRVMFDRAGNLLPEPLDVDLSLPGGNVVRSIKRTIDSNGQQAKFMRAFVLSITREDQTPKRAAPSTAVPPAPRFSVNAPTMEKAQAPRIGRPESLPDVIPFLPVGKPESLPDVIPFPGFVPGPPASKSQPAEIAPRGLVAAEMRAKVVDPRLEGEESVPGTAPILEPPTGTRSRPVPEAAERPSQVVVGARARVSAPPRSKIDPRLEGEDSLPGTMPLVEPPTTSRPRPTHAPSSKGTVEPIAPGEASLPGVLFSPEPPTGSRSEPAAEARPSQVVASLRPSGMAGRISEVPRAPGNDPRLEGEDSHPGTSSSRSARVAPLAAPVETRQLPRPKTDTAATVARSWQHFAEELSASRDAAGAEANDPPGPPPAPDEPTRRAVWGEELGLARPDAPAVEKPLSKRLEESSPPNSAPGEPSAWGSRGEEEPKP